MLVPKLRVGDEALFLGFTFIVEMRMMRRDQQCTWWWKEINTKRRTKFNTLGFRGLGMIGWTKTKQKKKLGPNSILQAL
jgi:hypothetical protein